MSEKKKYMFSTYENPHLVLYDQTLYNEKDQSYFERYMIVELTDEDYEHYRKIEDIYNYSIECIENLQEEYAKNAPWAR